MVIKKKIVNTKIQINWISASAKDLNEYEIHLNKRTVLFCIRNIDIF